MASPRTLRARAGSQLVRRFQDDPAFFAAEVLGVHLWSMQRDIVESIGAHRKTAVRSCHGTGKTFDAAVAVLWFLYSFPGSRVVTTATTWPQVRDLLWHEINQLYTRARARLGGQCLQTRLYLPDGRYAVGLSTRPGQEESFAGHHAEHLLLAFDEASGIPQGVYDVGEGYMTTEGARQLLIGNPTRPGGEFFAAFHSKRDDYQTFHISAFDTPAFTGEQVPDDVARKLVSRQWVTEREKWQGTPLWDVRVMGNFPRSGSNTVIPLETVEAAQKETVVCHPDDPETLAVDVARFGTDETVIAHRKGRWCRIQEAYVGKDTMQTAGHVIRLAKERKAETGTAPRIVVDDTGVGGGVTDRCRELGWEVQAFNGGESAIEDDAYPNLRSESWFVCADELEGADLDDDEQLAADLVAPTYKLDSKGRRVVEPKDDTKKRIGRSPDRGDAIVLAFTAPRSTLMEVW